MTMGSDVRLLGPAARFIGVVAVLAQFLQVRFRGTEMFRGHASQGVSARGGICGDR